MNMIVPSNISQERMRHRLINIIKEDPDEVLHPGFSGLLSYASGRNDLIGLFWELYNPLKYVPKRENRSDVSEELDGLVQNLLEYLYQQYYVPYEPDEDVISEDDFQESLESGHIIIPDKLKGLIIFLHVAAARAFRIKLRQGGGLDEVALTCLEETERTYRHIRYLDRRGMGISEILNRDLSQTFLLSTYAVGAKALAELGRVRHREGRYADALHYMAEAVYETNYAAVRYIADESIAAKIDAAIPLATIIPLKDHLVKGLDDISPQDIASTFSSLKASGQTDSWSQVVKDCDYLIQASELPYTFSDSDYPVQGTFVWFENVKNDEGYFLTWGEFWYAAKAWASAQLSPSDLMKLRAAEKQEEERKATENARTASETRLKNYVFGIENWGDLPKRAKDCLITLDGIWNSSEEVAWDTMLEGLSQATRAICHHSLWVSMEEGGIPKDLPNDRLEKPLRGVVRLANGQGFFELKDCVEALRDSQVFKRFLTQREIDEADVEFLTQTLPKALDSLRESRNDAVHTTTESWGRDEVRNIVEEFLGIGGKPGILPELVRIGRKLRRV